MSTYCVDNHLLLTNCKHDFRVRLSSKVIRVTRLSLYNHLFDGEQVKIE